MGLVRLASRSLFSTIFVIAGYQTMREPGMRPQRVSDTLGLPEPELMVRVNGVAMLVLGSALALGVKPRLAAAGLAGVLVPTTYAGHQFWAEETEQGKRMQQVHFLKNLSLIGGLLSYAAGDPRR